jgi:hypothetical protein
MSCFVPDDTKELQLQRRFKRNIVWQHDDVSISNHKSWSFQQDVHSEGSITIKETTRNIAKEKINALRKKEVETQRHHRSTFDQSVRPG